MHMFEFLYILIGVVVGAGGMYLRLRKYVAQSSQASAQREEYYRLWSEAVGMLTLNNQLTPEQVANITPTKQGSSGERREIEILRAMNRLPPADNLLGMSPDDIHAVRMARIKHGTVR
jgi:hypothetical protein